ncbi:putative f-box wd repeat containing protein lin-23 [Diplodia seriata]|nr:putative f-box wd repeat containing protein lin-23 [Diplodia seriata]
MVQRRRSTLSFRPKSAHPAADPEPDNAIPRPPKRTQSQVFGPHDVEAEASAWRHSHHAGPEKEAKLSHDTHRQESHRRQSTLHNIELALSTVRDLIHRRGQSQSQSAAASSAGPSRSQEATVDMRPQRSPSFANPPSDADVESLASSSPLQPSQTVPSSKHQAPKRWASARRSLKKFRRPAVSGPANDRWNPLPPPSLGPPYIDHNAGQAARDSANQLNAMNLSLHSRSRSKVSPCGQMSETDSVIGDDQGQLVAQPPRMDFVQRFPRELSEHVFSFLDASSLAICERVSRGWREPAQSRHVWRVVFNRQYEQQVHVEPPPLQMGGIGTGMAQSYQDWKLMYHIRRTIERRWRSSHPAAVYFNGHTDSVYCCQFDENKIITGSRDRTIRVWDLKTYKCLKVIGGPEARPQPNTPPTLDIKRQYTESNIPSVNGTPEGHAIYHQPAFYHSASILCLQFDDEIVVTGSSDSSCIVWDIKTWEPKWRLNAHEAGVLDVCFDSRYIISCSKDNSICIWDRNTGELLKQLRGHRGPVNAVQMRGDLLVSASGDGAAMLWNIKTKAFVKELRSGDRGLAAVEFSDDAKYVLAGGNDQTVYKFDITTGQVVKKYTGHTGLVRSLFLDTPNKRVLSGSYDQSIRVYDYETGEDVSVYDNWTTSWILSAKSDYRRIVATSQDGRALLLDFGYGIKDVEILASAR